MTFDAPLVSFVLATHNRCAVVLNTLARLQDGYPPSGRGHLSHETIVVDNASSDGTPDAIARQFPWARVLRRQRNGGSCAKADGVEIARGPSIVFLDDDSFPRPGTVERMLAHFGDDSNLAAAGFTVHLPDGRRECSALPGVFVGCGVGLRAAALREVGGLDAGFFMQAEEYDLCFRLASAGYRVDVFDDLHVAHLKTNTARCSARTVYYDTRNNLVVAARHLPHPFDAIYRADCWQRYHWIAQREGRLTAFWRGAAVGLVRAPRERRRFKCRRLTAASFERFFQINEIERRMSGLRGNGVERILLADMGKNVYPFVRGARRCGLDIAAILDDRFAAAGRTYRGVPVRPVDEIGDLGADAVVVSNCAAVHAEATRERLGEVTDLPIYAWYAPPPNSVRIRSMPALQTADKPA